MKKLLLIIAVAVAFSACQNDDHVSYKIDRTIVIYPDHWEAYPSSDPAEFLYWEYAWIIDDFYGHAFWNGIYQTYHEWETGNGVVVRDPLTVVNFLEGTPNWTETMACDYSEGEVRLYLKPSDFAPVPPAEKMFFRFIAIW